MAYVDRESGGVAMIVPLHARADATPLASSIMATDGPMTRVQLVRIAGQLETRLRFGRPSRTVAIARQQRVALFGPGAVFCRLRRELVAGETRWQLLVLMTSASQAGTQIVDGIKPGVLTLAQAEGASQVNPVLQQIGAIGAQGIDAAEVAPAYWRTLHNRLSAGMALPDYTIERHADYLVSRVIR